MNNHEATHAEQPCEHEFVWDQTDGLDGICIKCSLYVMKPDCVSKTYKWFKANGLPWGDEDDPPPRST